MSCDFNMFLAALLILPQGIVIIDAFWSDSSSANNFSKHKLSIWVYNYKYIPCLVFYWLTSCLQFIFTLYNFCCISVVCSGWRFWCLCVIFNILVINMFLNYFLCLFILLIFSDISFFLVSYWMVLRFRLVSSISLFIHCFVSLTVLLHWVVESSIRDFSSSVLL